jgi:hypothetical protein
MARKAKESHLKVAPAPQSKPLEHTGEQGNDPRLKRLKVSYLLDSKVVTELQAATLQTSATEDEVNSAFTAGVSRNRERAIAEFLGEATQNSRSGEKLFDEYLTTALRHLTTLKHEPARHALEMLAVVKRFVKALEKNHLTLSELPEPSVFIFRNGGVVLSEYQAPPAKNEPPAPPHRTLEIHDLSVLRTLLNTAVPVIRRADGLDEAEVINKRQAA